MAFQDWIKGAAAKATELAKQAATDATAKAAEMAKQAAADFTERRQQAALEAALHEQRAAAARAEAERQAAAQRAEQQALQQRMAEIRPVIDARWPPQMFPRTPPAVLAEFRRQNPKAHPLNMVEDLPDRWMSILESYPEPPEDDDERKVREAQFWRSFLKQAVVTKADGSKRLMPKQEVIDRYWTSEKWLLREYYAATGIYIKTYVGEEFNRHYIWEPIDVEEEFQRRLADPNSDLSRTRPVLFSRDVYDKAAKDALRQWVPAENERQRQEVKQYWDKADAHQEKWGNWWFFNIEQAFKAEYQQRSADTPSADL